MPLFDAGEGLRLRGEPCASYSAECSWHVQGRISPRGFLQSASPLSAGIGKTQLQPCEVLASRPNYQDLRLLGDV